MSSRRKKIKAKAGISKTPSVFLKKIASLDHKIMVFIRVS